MNKWIRLLPGYLWQNRWQILFFTVLCAVLGLVYSLYQLPWGPAAYTLLLFLAAAFLSLVLGFHRHVRRLEQLEVLKKQAAYHLGALPEPANPEEQAYQQVLQQLEARCRRTESDTGEALAKAQRYYTLWSHQAKTPLAAIRLLLQEQPMDRTALEQEAFRVEQYVEMALQYQRLETKGADLVLRRCSIDSLVRQALKKTAPLFLHRSLSLTLGDLQGTVLTDEKWLVFVLEQVITNAVKYTPSGSIAIGLEPKEGFEQEGVLHPVLCVADAGIGIRPEDLPRVFEWGYTGYNGRKEQQSTGIGLALCRETMEMLGHKIRIQSAQGQGTRVLLDLYRADLETE